MEYFIRKNSTLTILEINLVKDGRYDFNFIGTDLSGSTIYFNMKDNTTGVYKVAKGICTYSPTNNSIYYQFTKKNTKSVGRFEAEFDVYTNQGLIKLPLPDKVFVNILDSFSNSEFCCGPNKNIGPVPVPTLTTTPTPSPTPTPTPTPTPSPTPTPTPADGVYYGKNISPTISLAVVATLTFDNRTSIVNSYVNIPQGDGFGYLLVPTGYTQTSAFVNSTNGCDGVIIPMNIISQIVVNDINNTPITYNVYRTYWPIGGQITAWMCS